MRAFALALAAALSASACGGAGQPAPATAAPTAAATTAAPLPAAKAAFTADLKAENEVPPISNEEKSGSGKATITFDLTRDASGAVTAAKASFEITLTGFPATTAITLAHIHAAPAGQNGGVKVGIKTDAANQLKVTDGKATISVKDVTVDAATMQAILDKPGDFYVNVHSVANAGGVVRGQLTKM